MNKLNKKDLIYISGGMTGYQNFNYNFFNKRVKEYREQGYNVETPSTDIPPMLANGNVISIEELHKLIDNGLMTEKDAWKCFLRGDINDIIKNVKQIYMLPGWLASKGARLERYIALKMGCQIEYERPFVVEVLYAIKFFFVTKVLKRKIKEIK